MDTNQQEELKTEQEQPNATQEQLLEIYKLHAQLVSDSSNRRATTNRFYPTLMSGLLVIFFTFLQRKGEIFPEESKELVVGVSILIVGYLGSIFSMIWFISIRGYLRAISRKYEVLKKLEGKFEFRFFRQEWKLISKDRKNVTYTQLSIFELFVPYTFLLVFMLFIVVGVFKVLLIIDDGSFYEILKPLFNGQADSDGNPDK